MKTIGDDENDVAENDIYCTSVDDANLTEFKKVLESYDDEVALPEIRDKIQSIIEKNARQ